MKIFYVRANMNQPTKLLWMHCIVDALQKTCTGQALGLVNTFFGLHFINSPDCISIDE
jgi:hypothetical protein